MSAKELLEARFRWQCEELSKTARQLADMDASHMHTGIDVRNYPGDAPVLLQIFAAPPGTNFMEGK